MRRTADETESALPRAARRRTRARAALSYGVLVLLSLLYCWDVILGDRVLLPTNPATIVPWAGNVAPEAALSRSNGLMADALIFTLPARIYNREMLSSGRLPFWNPHVFAGYPHLALIQNNALYPLSVPFDLIDPLAGLGYSIFLHLALAGCLMYAFLRRSGLGDAAALVGGAAFELNGMFLVRQSAPSYVFSGTWLPLLLIGTLALARGARLRGALAVTAGTMLSVLGGHPQITSLALVLAAAHLLVEASGRASRARPWGIELGRPLASFVLLVTLGVALAGFQVVPFLELMANSARESVGLDAYRSSALPPAGLLQALVPDVFGHPAERGYWFTQHASLLDGVTDDARGWVFNYAGENVFTGIAPLVLAVVAVTRSTHHREVSFFAIVALASLAILLGTPLLDAAYRVLPGFRYSRPDRIVFLYVTALAVLSAYGVGALGGDRSERGRSQAALVLLAFLGLVILWPLLPRLADRASRAQIAQWLDVARAHWWTARAELSGEVAASFAVFAASLVLVISPVRRRLPPGLAALAWIALVATPNILFGWRFNPTQERPRFGDTRMERLLAGRSSEPTRIARVLSGMQPVLPANTAQISGIDDIHGASAAGVEGYLELIAAADPGAVNKQKYFRALHRPELAASGLLDLLNVEFVLSDLELPPSVELLGREDEIGIYRRRTALARFFVVERVERYADEAQARRVLLSAEHDPAGEVLVPEGTPLDLPPSAGADSGSPARVQIERHEPHAIALRVSAPRGGVLVSSEVFYPGWTARVDGSPTALLRVNTAFRGVAVPAGSHRVEMILVPYSFYAGAAVTAVAMALVALVCFRRW